jgi:hypothetical protein
VNEDAVGQVLRDYQALRRPATDPGLEAVSTAILLEDVFGIVLPDDLIDQAALSDPAAVAALVARLKEGP